MRIDYLDNLQTDDLDNLQVLSQEELQFVLGGFGYTNIIIGGQGSDTIVGGDVSDILVVVQSFSDWAMGWLGFGGDLGDKLLKIFQSPIF